MTLSDRINRVLDLQPGEGRPVAVMTAYFTLLIFAFLVGRTVRDALFLANFGMDYLPWMYVGTAVSVSLSSQLYSRVAPKLNPRMLGYLTVFGFAAVFVAFRLGVGAFPGLAAYAALYLWVEIFGGLALLEFWNLAGEVFDARQAKRLFGLVSAGQVASNLLCGAFSSTLSKAWGAENLLWLAGGALLLVLPLLAWIGRYRSGRRTAKKAPPKLFHTDPAYRKHMGYLQTIAAVVAFTFISTSLIDFQFKLAAKAAFAGKDELARYFGIFYAAVGTVGFFLQTFFTGRITKALGVLETLAIMPVFFVLGSIGQLVAPGLSAATATKFSENTLRYSINDPVTQLLYLPLPASLRLRALALASGTIKPMATGSAGLLMLAVRPLAASFPSVFSWVVALLCAGWLALLVRLKTGYLGAVASGAEESRRLVWERPKLDPQDPLVRDTLLRTLDEADPTKIDYALSVAEKVDIDGLDGYLRRCLARSGTGRARVLRTLETRRDAAFAYDIRTCTMPNEPPFTRAAAYRALAAVQGDAAVPFLRRALSDHSPVVRAGALEGLVLYGGERGLAVALVDLDKMLTAADPVVRVLALRVVARTPVPHPFQLLEPLLDDPEFEVAREVIRTLGARCDEEAIEPLLAALTVPVTAPAAAEALGKYGEKVVDLLTDHLRDDSHAPAVREAALKGLAANAAPRAGDSLALLLRHLPWSLRLLGSQALQRKLRQGTWGPTQEIRDELERACRAQISETAWYKSVGELEPGPSVLGTTLAEKVTACELQALRIASVVWPREELTVLVRSAVLVDARKRSLLVEICDNVLSGDVKNELLPLLENHDRQAALRLAERHRPVPVAGSPMIAALAKSGDRWLRACAVWTAIESGWTETITGTSEARTMMDLVEKVLLLKSATLFQHLSGAEIEKIAGIAQECEFPAGRAVFEMGDPGDALYVVTHGQVRVHVGDKQIAVLKERDCFGEMAILDDQSRSASVSAVSDVQCLSLRRDDFFFLLEDHFEIVKSIIRVLTERLRNNLAQAAPAGAGK